MTTQVANNNAKIHTTHPLNADQIHQYHKNGYVIIRNFFDREEIEPLRKACEADPSMRGVQTTVNDKAGGYFKVALWSELGDTFLGVMPRMARMIDTVETLLGGMECYHWHSKIVRKLTGDGQLHFHPFLERNLILTNSAGVNAVAVAEFVLTFMLYHTKQVKVLETLQHQRTWLKGLELKELIGKTLLIIGTGYVGIEIAQRAKAFGMRVLGIRRHPQPIPEFEQIVGLDKWRSLLSLADYLVVAIPSTSETQGMIDESALRAMSSHAYLINVARGAVVNEPALLKALTEGWIAGAALDTFITEPLPSESPFWSLPNVFVTPHCAGMSSQLRKRLIALFLDNLNRYLSGLPLRNIVNQQLKY